MKTNLMQSGAVEAFNSVMTTSRGLKYVIVLGCLKWQYKKCKTAAAVKKKIAKIPSNIFFL